MYIKCALLSDLIVVLIINYVSSRKKNITLFKGQPGHY